MAAANSKWIEEAATTALSQVFLSCPILSPFINRNDRTPSWDGAVFVYQNAAQKKEDLLGRVPIQVKGTQKLLTSDTASFPCSVADLRNYCNDGGCIFFLVSVPSVIGEADIYYSSLQVFDLKRKLDEIGNQKSCTIKLTRFPSKDINEISAIFTSFIENSRKQASFIKHKLVSLEELTRNGVTIESLTFNASGIGLNELNLGKYLSSHDFYLYAKPKGLDIEIPVDKVCNATVVKRVDAKVTVRDVEYYPFYTVVYYKEGAAHHIQLGKGIAIKLDLSSKKFNISFKASGTLSDLIQDASCYIDIIESREVAFNGEKLAFSNPNWEGLSKSKKRLRYYKDVKKMLDTLGVTEELQCDNLTAKDEEKIRSFVAAILYNKKFGFPGIESPSIYGAFSIANLSIWIWAIRKEDGYYQIKSFFDAQQFAFFEESDTAHAHPIPASQYFLLDKTAFAHASNMNYDAILKSITSLAPSPKFIPYTTDLLLEIIRAYDEQTNKDGKLLELADSLCTWLSTFENEKNDPVIRLNHLQIIKRKRSFVPQEIIELSGFTNASYPAEVRCSAYLLLGDNCEAQKCFAELSPSMQETFISLPIFHFANFQ